MRIEETFSIADHLAILCFSFSFGELIFGYTLTLTLSLYATISLAALFTDIPITVYSLRKMCPTTPQYVTPVVTPTVTDFTFSIAMRFDRNFDAHLKPICDSSSCLSPRKPNTQRNIKSLSKRDVLFTHPCIPSTILQSKSRRKIDR